MPKFVRVRDNRTGHEYSTARVDPQHHTVLDRPAVSATGKPLPAKPRRNLPRFTAPSTPGPEADTTEESSDDRIDS